MEHFQTIHRSSSCWDFVSDRQFARNSYIFRRQTVAERRRSHVKKMRNRLRLLKARSRLCEVLYMDGCGCVCNIEHCRTAISTIYCRNTRRQRMRWCLDTTNYHQLLQPLYPLLRALLTGKGYIKANATDYYLRQAVF